MLSELSHVRQIEGERRRRWFQSPDADLIVWYEGDGAIYGFQLCYDRRSDERALTWTPEHGFAHNRIDDGEGIGLGYKRTPILVADGMFDAGQLGSRFAGMSALVPHEIVAFVLQKLARYRDEERAN
jgi:hypothetical protein